MYEFESIDIFYAVESKKKLAIKLLQLAFIWQCSLLKKCVFGNVASNEG